MSDEIDDLRQNVLVIVRKEDRRVHDMRPLGVVLYTISAGSINDTVLCGDIVDNTRPYSKHLSARDMCIYARSDFGMNRGFESEFIYDATPEQVEEAVSEMNEELEAWEDFMTSRASVI